MNLTLKATSQTQYSYPFFWLLAYCLLVGSTTLSFSSIEDSLVETRMSFPTRSKLMPIPEYPTLALGMKSGRPFVVRNPSEFTYTKDLLISGFLSEPVVWGYKKGWELVTEDDTLGTLDDWKQARLSFNIVDSPATGPRLTPNELFVDSGDSAKDQLQQTYVLTGGGYFSVFHVDPPYGDAWMHLKEGRKRWWFVSPKEVERLQDMIISQGYADRTFPSMGKDECLSILDSRVEGPILEGEIGPGDFLWFPKEWGHCVETYERSIGIGGYSSPVSES